MRLVYTQVVRAEMFTNLRLNCCWIKSLKVHFLVLNVYVWCTVVNLWLLRRNKPQDHLMEIPCSLLVVTYQPYIWPMCAQFVSTMEHLALIKAIHNTPCTKIVRFKNLIQVYTNNSYWYSNMWICGKSFLVNINGFLL